MVKAGWFGAVLAAPLALAGCGNLISTTDHAGRLGVKLADNGAVVVVVAPCEKGTAVVSIYHGSSPDMADDMSSTLLGEWTAKEANDEESLLNLSLPSFGWEGEVVESPDARTTWLVEGTFKEDSRTMLRGPSVTLAELSELEPDQVLTDAGVEMRADFDGDC